MTSTTVLATSTALQWALHPAFCNFSAATYSVAENGGSATITITRTGGSAGAVGVTVATSNGTATAPADYTAVTQTVSFAAGDTANKTVNIPIVDDAAVEANETVNLALSNPTGGATLGSPNTAVLTITDNDARRPGTLQFSAATYSVAENGGTATITVTRTGGSAGAVGVTVHDQQRHGDSAGRLHGGDADGQLCRRRHGQQDRQHSDRHDTRGRGNETVNVALSVRPAARRSARPARRC